MIGSMPGILDKKIYVMAYYVSLVKLDTLDKAPLNDETISRQQKLYSGRRFTSHKLYILLCPWAQMLSGDIPVDAGLSCNKAAVGNCLLYTCHL